ncbi:ClbS/DfsB family four-helix bundle protein [Maribacter sp. HTCC2170]|uniref:ClbS/DfsB family four-helix bundle protein n=1 Tax=Maribacter sp. (strain HTCC2170 / KCCM 42371) TaxID=313603 RepID=UPI00006B221E|nr:ClbS/DfsB family four-helix bundle protein [Maribacter sp. HTCC2170]EAR00345.1 hypothetical protein FB2170_13026 [Maribacter sp. HTCC2170]
MPRPKTKTELLQLSNENYKKLNNYVDSFPLEEHMKEFPEGTMNRNIRDVLGHLHHWHLLVQGWYKVGMSGEKPELPAKGYTWKTTSDLNHNILKKYANEELGTVRANLDESYAQLQKLIKKHTDEELFEKKRYKWTGSTSLGAYLISATSSHYDWAYKLIKKARK